MEDERIGLLSLKDALNFPNGSALPSWRADRQDCCQWEHIKCDNIADTMRVTKLHLFGTRDYKLPQPWSLDASLFLPLEELQVLDLIDNGIAGPLFLSLSLS